MSMPMIIVEIIKKTFSQRFLLAKLTRQKYMGKLIDRALFDGDSVIFLPKSKIIKLDAPIAKPAETVLPSQVVDHFIDKANYHWLMYKCICRDASNCRDYPIGMGCLFLGEAAKGINPKLGRQISKSEAFDHARKCREAGLVHLIGRNKLDSVWLNVGPGNKLLTICNCCPCCCLWNFLPDLDKEISDKVTKMPGVEVKVNENCIGCGTCLDKCFAHAIAMQGDRANISTACRGCGRCVALCRNDAIDISIDMDRCVKETIGRIEPLVDLS